MDRAVFDNEKFISLIEPNSCLWDTSHEDYFDRNKKQRCWVEIAKQMCDNFEEMTSVQQNEYGKYIFIYTEKHDRVGARRFCFVFEL